MSSSTNSVDAEHSFKVNVFYPTIDIALYELKNRFEGQNYVMKLFSFLLPSNLAKSSPEEIECFTKRVIEQYSTDFSDDLVFEIRSFSAEFKSEKETQQTVLDVANFLQDICLCSSLPTVSQIATPSFNNSSHCCFSRTILFKT